jgi:hypothetical protein
MLPHTKPMHVTRFLEDVRKLAISWAVVSHEPNDDFKLMLEVDFAGIRVTCSNLL